MTRHILEQTRRNADDLAAIRSQLARIEQRQDRTDGEVRALRADFVGLRGEFAALRQELPGLIADTLREVLRERDR